MRSETPDIADFDIDDSALTRDRCTQNPIWINILVRINTLNVYSYQKLYIEVGSLQHYVEEWEDIETE